MSRAAALPRRAALRLRRARALGPAGTARRALQLARLAADGYAIRLRDSLSGDPLDERRFPWLGPAGGEGDERLFRGPLCALPVAAGAAAAAALGDLSAPDWLAGAAARAVDHTFDLLGSGPVGVGYSAAAPGLEGNRYAMAPGPAAAEAQRARMERLLPGVAREYRPIDWHVDFRSGFRWRPETWYGDVVYGDVPGADVKVPWELARLQHAGALGLAHRLLPDTPEGGRAAAELRAQIVDWIAANPLRRGVGWACPMDVAIRAVSWLIGLSLCDDAPAMDGRFRRLLARALHLHAEHIRLALEYSPGGTGNHYLSDVVGLVAIGAALPESPAADRWLRFGLQELVSEMRRQVLPDGGDVEGSTAYHHLVAELFLVATLVALRLPGARRERLRVVRPGRFGGAIAPRLLPLDAAQLHLDRPDLFPRWYLDRLLAMAEYAAAVTKPDGRIAQVGDHDSGRLYRLGIAVPGTCGGPQDPLDLRHVQALAGALFGHRGLAAQGAGFALDARLFTAGLDPARLDAVRAAVAASTATAPATAQTAVAPTPAEAAATPRSTASPASAAPEPARPSLIRFPHAGVAVATCGPLWLLASIARVPAGQGGGHFHNDLLSFVLQWRGLDLVVDGGAYVYTPLPERRNEFRRTAAHSTLAVDGVEQRGWPPREEGLFLVTWDAEVEVLDVAPGLLRVAAAYRGIQHERVWRWGEDWLEIEDRVGPLPLPPVAFNLNLAPGLAVELAEVGGPDGIALRLGVAGIVAVCTFDGLVDPCLAPGCWSQGYGARVPSQRFVGRLAGTAARTRIELRRDE